MANRGKADVPLVADGQTVVPVRLAVLRGPMVLDTQRQVQEFHAHGLPYSALSHAAASSSHMPRVATKAAKTAASLALVMRVRVMARALPPRTWRRGCGWLTGAPNHTALTARTNKYEEIT